MANKKGFVEQMFFILILVMVFVVIVVGWYAYSLTAPMVQHTMGQVSNEIAIIPNHNVALYGNMTVGNVSKGIDNTLPWLGYSLLIVGFLGFMFIAFLVRSYPFLAIFWVIFMVVMIFCSIFMSISYSQTLSSDPTTAAIYRANTANHFINSNLPILLVGQLIACGLILFLLVSRDQDAEYAI